MGIFELTVIYDFKTSKKIQINDFVFTCRLEFQWEWDREIR